MEPVFKSPPGQNFFFGYFDKSPISANGTRLLACRSNFIDRPVKNGDTIDIGYFNWKRSNKFEKITSSSAWNWQQGCMLQWLGTQCSDKIIYNDVNKEKFVSVIFDIKTNKKRILPMPIYALEPGGRFALCIDFERHYWYRNGYNYQGVRNPDKKIPYDKDDGIWRLNIDTSCIKRILSLETLVKINPVTGMSKSVHYVEHINISPNGKRFMFIHRWKTSDNNIYSRLFTANIDGSEIFLVNDSGRVTHACWANDGEIVAWCGKENLVNKLRSNVKLSKYLFAPLLPFYHRLTGQNSKINQLATGDSYYRFLDKSSFRERLSPELLNEDGHPSFNPKNKQVMLTDTYEDSNHKRTVLLFDMKSKKVRYIAKLKSMPDLDKTTYRCDLHPRWSTDGNFVIVDTTNEFFRQIYVYKV